MERCEKEKCCGNCCWFYAEDTYGYGACPFRFGECVVCDSSCRSKDDYVSKKQMRHYMAVLVKRFRYLENMVDNNPPYLVDDIEAEKFAYKYMKVFGNL